MLKRIDKTGKQKTIYECDMCGKNVNVENRVGIHIKKGMNKSMWKEWDLCNECYRMLSRSIRKYKERKLIKN